ncbi:hypothetical protein D3C86_2267870 [compost metagenome]
MPMIVAHSTKSKVCVPVKLTVSPSEVKGRRTSAPIPAPIPCKAVQCMALGASGDCMTAALIMP